MCDAHPRGRIMLRLQRCEAVLTILLVVISALASADEFLLALDLQRRRHILMAQGVLIIRTITGGVFGQVRAVQTGSADDMSLMLCVRSQVRTAIQNLILGQICVEHTGVYRVCSHTTGLTAVMELVKPKQLLFTAKSRKEAQHMVCFSIIK